MRLKWTPLCVVFSLGLSQASCNGTENRCYLGYITSQSTHILSHVIFFDLLGLLSFRAPPPPQTQPPTPTSILYPLHYDQRAEQPGLFTVAVDIRNYLHLFSVVRGQEVHGGSNTLGSLFTTLSPRWYASVQPNCNSKYVFKVCLNVLPHMT